MAQHTDDAAPSRLIAIGVSADGVEALACILRALPSNLPAAIVVTPHGRKEGAGTLEEPLGRRTKLRVHSARLDEPLRAGTVYVAPPDRHLVVDASRLHLDSGPPVGDARPSLDVMFRSVAAAWGPRSIGVILSGSGRDGAEALQAIRKAGGIVVVQSPRDARFPVLSREAIAADHVHFVPNIETIGPLLARLVSRPDPGVGDERDIALGDGTRVRLRRIRPDDEPRLVALYDRLSKDSRYQRFFSVMQRLPPDWAHFLANVDHVQRFALVVEAPDDPTTLIAVARYEPAGEADTAEVAFVVQDAWQNRGLGTVLFRELLAAAAANGIKRFRAWVLGDNRRMLDLIARLGDVQQRAYAQGVVELTFTAR